MDLAVGYLKRALGLVIPMLEHKGTLLTLRGIACLATIILLLGLLLPHLGIAHRTEIVRGPFQVETPGSAGLLVFLEKSGFPKQLVDSGSDLTRGPDGSKLLLAANGIPLGPAHSQHDAIRRGDPPGSFSHWGDYVLFSLPKGLSNTSDIELVIDYDISLNSFLVQNCYVVLIVSFCLLILRQLSLNKSKEDALSAKVFGAFWLLSTGFLVAAIAGTGAFFISFAYGLLDGYALPNTAIFFQADIFRTLAKLEPTIPQVVLTYALTGFLLSRWAHLLPDNQKAYRHGEDCLASSFQTWGFFLIMGWLIFSLGGSWAGVPRNEDFNSAALAGLLPFNDAAVHFDTSFYQTYIGQWGSFGSRRPIAALVRSTMMFVVGYSMPRFLLLQAALLAFAVVWATRYVIRWRGVWAGLSFLGMSMLIVRPYVQTTLTEPLGLFFAFLAIPFLVRSLETDSLKPKLEFFALMLIALLIRMGNMFFIPAIGIWILVTGKSQNYAWLRRVFSVFCVAFVILAGNQMVSKTYGSSQGVLGGNFSYVFCGLTHGENWTYCPSKYGEEMAVWYEKNGFEISEAKHAEFLYQKGFTKLRDDPSIFINRIKDAVSAFVAIIPTLMSRGYLGYSTPPFFPVTLWLFLCGIGLLVLIFREMREREIVFWTFFCVSLMASASLVYFDDGIRTLCVSYPLVALLIASAFRVDMVKNLGSTDIRPCWRSSHRRFMLFLVPAVFSSFLATPLFAEKTDILHGRVLEKMKAEQVAQHSHLFVFFPSRYMAGFVVVPDDAKPLKYVPSIRWSDFQAILAYSGIEQYERIVPELPPEVPFGLVFAPGVSKIEFSGSSHLLVPHYIFEDRFADGWKMELTDKTIWKRVVSAQPIHFAH